jgi:hypothetical protein
LDEAHLAPEVTDYIARLTMNIESTLSSARIWDIVNLRDQSMQLAAALQVFVADSDVDPVVKAEFEPLLVRLRRRLQTSFWVDVVPKMIGAGVNVGQKAIEGKIASPG